MRKAIVLIFAFALLVVAPHAFAQTARFGFTDVLFPGIDAADD